MPKCPKCKEEMEYVEVSLNKETRVIYDFKTEEYRDEEPAEVRSELVFCPHCSALLGEDGVDAIDFEEEVVK